MLGAKIFFKYNLRGVVMKRDRSKTKRMLAGAIALLIILALVLGMIIPFF